MPRESTRPPTTARSLVDLRRHRVSTNGDTNIDMDQLRAPSHSEMINSLCYMPSFETEDKQASNANYKRP